MKIVKTLCLSVLALASMAAFSAEDSSQAETSSAEDKVTVATQESLEGETSDFPAPSETEENLSAPVSEATSTEEVK